MKNTNAAAQYSDLFKQLRKDRNLTQKSLANLLGVSQATVSLIEAGQKIPTEEVFLKFHEIFLLTESRYSKDLENEKQSRKSPLYPVKEIYTKMEVGRGRLNVAGIQITRGQKSGGDVIEIHRLTNTETLFFVADAVGHGNEGFPEAQLIKVAFSSVITAQPKISSTASVIEYIQQGLRKGGSGYWSRHSMLAAISNLDMDAIEVRSSGIPAPIFSGLQESNFSHFINRNLSSGKISTSVGPLFQGDSVLIFTDGILDPSLEISRKDLEEQFYRYNRMFPGDASAIAKKIANFPKDNIRDDVTILVISRPKE